MKIISIALVSVAVLAGSAHGASKGTTVDLVAYSTPKDAFGKIISAFQKTSAGSGVGFSQSYNASFDQARAVAAGQSADVVALSLDPDIDYLVRKGHVLLTYENDAIFANKKGVHTDYHIPKATILIETPAALTKSGLKKPAAKSFYRYIWSATAQRAFADQGYRPVLKSVAKGRFY